MPEVQIRKRLTVVEEIFHEGGPAATTPLKRAAALVIIHNPYAGTYIPDISGFMDDLKPLGLSMAKTLVDALGGDPKTIEGYGKGAIVGSAGEIEHGDFADGGFHRSPSSPLISEDFRPPTRA